MKRIIKRIQQKSGFISIETIIVSGLTLALGAWAFKKFYAIGEVTIDQAIEITSTAMDVSVSGQ